MNRAIDVLLPKSSTDGFSRRMGKFGSPIFISVLSACAALVSYWFLALGAGLILLIAVYCVLIGALAVRFPRFAWVLYFISISVTGIVFEVGPAKVHAELLALPLLWVCIARLRHLDIRSILTPVHSVTMLSVASGYFLWAGITSGLNAPNPFPSIWMLIQVLAGFVSYFLIRQSESEKVWMIQAGTIIIGGISAISILGWIARTVFGLPLAEVPGVASDGRLIGFSFETNIFASQCVAWIALCSRRWASLGRLSKALNFVLGIAVVLAGTRSAWIALAFVLFVSACEGVRRTRKWLWGIVGLLSAFPWILSTVASPAEAQSDSLLWRLSNLLNSDVGTGAYRFNIYETAIDDITNSQRLWWGSGMNSFSQFHLIDATGVSSAYLSSVWISAVYDTGLIGFLLFIALLVIVVLSTRKRFDGLVVVGAVMICASATNLVWFQYPWICMALLEVAKRDSERTRRADHLSIELNDLQASKQLRSTSIG